MSREIGIWTRSVSRLIRDDLHMKAYRRSTTVTLLTKFFISKTKKSTQRLPKTQKIVFQGFNGDTIQLLYGLVGSRL